MSAPAAEMVEKYVQEENERILELFANAGGHSLWLHNHCRLLWRIVNWNWFNIFTGEEGFWLFAKHGFREWGSMSSSGGGESE